MQIPSCSENVAQISRAFTKTRQEKIFPKIIEKPLDKQEKICYNDKVNR